MGRQNVSELSSPCIRIFPRLLFTISGDMCLWKLQPNELPHFRKSAKISLAGAGLPAGQGDDN
jgi:hypothetical protein